MTKQIRTLLVANRGEIACRIMRTASRLGISTVAVYADADANAEFVKMADVAVHIGPSPAAESYLVIDKIIDAAKRTGADAIHPGYGFLSENPEFARRLADEGIIFIGPTAESMEAMALKGAAKQLMIDAGVPVVPGYHGDAQDDATLIDAAKAIGFPLLIKAVAGGGGKGMRTVFNEGELAGAIKGARSEGEKSFGNGKLLIEKLIQKPRHIEVQVFGDTQGNVVHLLERDCSIQRRHQKVVEEAPAPNLSAKTRNDLLAAAVKAAAAIDYVGAGTIEFIADVPSKGGQMPFYFMEMNTRLQVEHPVTEEITGLDLVEWQIRVAEGKPLPKSQEAIVADSGGHSIEVRLYAEDPSNDFLPGIGTLTAFTIPSHPSVRLESGVVTGSEISIFYDPMIAKIITTGETREDARLAMVNSLKSAHIAGLVTNRDFLIKMLNHHNFVTGDVYTNLIADDYETLTKANEITDTDYLTCALSIANNILINNKKIDDPWSCNDGFSVNLPSTFTCLFQHSDQGGNSADEPPHTVQLSKQADGFDYAGDLYQITPSADSRIGITANGKTVHYGISQQDNRYTLSSDEKTVWIDVFNPDYSDSGKAGGSGALSAPMPGKILEILVTEGAQVHIGDTLLVLEAMKMEQRLTAAVDGTIKPLTVTKGDQVSQGQILIEIEENGAE